MFKKKQDSVKPYYKYLNINPLEDQIKILQGIFMWKLINDEQPKPIKEKFSLKKSTAKYGTMKFPKHYVFMGGTVNKLFGGADRGRSKNLWGGGLWLKEIKYL